MTYDDLKALIRKKGRPKYGKNAARLGYLAGAFFAKKGSMADVLKKTATRSVPTLCRGMGCNERHLRNLLEKFEEIETIRWADRKITYRFNPSPLESFDLVAHEKKQKRAREQFLRKQAERMKARRAQEKQAAERALEDSIRKRIISDMMAGTKGALAGKDEVRSDTSVKHRLGNT
jgi:hypothetical protein